jgi:hypothetical protein
MYILINHPFGIINICPPKTLQKAAKPTLLKLQRALKRSLEAGGSTTGIKDIRTQQLRYGSGSIEGPSFSQGLGESHKNQLMQREKVDDYNQFYL